jgi:hypothetical protein
MRKARSYAHIAAAKKWNNVFRLSALSQQKRAHEKHFRRIRAGQFRINEKGVTFMFVRGVDVIAKPSKTLEVADTIRERALPILRKQSGFVDEIVLVSDTEVDHVLALSFWNTKEDAERYHGDEYPTLYEPTCDGLGAKPFKIRPLDKDDAVPMGEQSMCRSCGGLGGVYEVTTAAP